MKTKPNKQKMDKTPYCKLHFSREFIADIAKEILEQGYKVYITRPVDEVINSIEYTDGYNWGYIELDRYYGVNMGTEYMSSKERGSGRRIFSNKVSTTYDDYLTVLQECNVDYMIYGCKPYSIEKDNVFGKKLVEVYL